MFFLPLLFLPSVYLATAPIALVAWPVITVVATAGALGVAK